MLNACLCLSRCVQANDNDNGSESERAADVERALAGTSHELAEVRRLTAERVQVLDALKTQVDGLVSRMDSLHARSDEAAARLDELASAPRPPESAEDASATYEELQRQLSAFEQQELQPLTSEAEALAQAARLLSEPPAAEEAAASGGHQRAAVLGADSAHALEHELDGIRQLLEQVAQQHATRSEQVEVALLRTGAFQRTFQSVLKWLAGLEQSVNALEPVRSQFALL